MESVLRNYREHEMELAYRMDDLLRYLSTSEGLLVLDKPCKNGNLWPKNAGQVSKE